MTEEEEDDEEERKSSSSSTSNSTTTASEDEKPTEQQPASMPMSSTSENQTIFKPDSLSVENLILDTQGSNYTSLKDMMDTPSINNKSPKWAATSPSTSRYYHYLEDMPIRNRLVKQAAYSYLQPKNIPDPQSSMRGEQYSWFGSMTVQDDDLGSSNSNGCIGFIRHVFFSAFNSRTSAADDDATETARGRRD
ncbi:hypothetical protein ZOSMA_338G00200 [Zostera marina]|uniref:Uncharacterized protein n=1 Tax=Zostera marina TaxID=29655 RepID=A0A0K9P809_ZOSMR|nr:hypothetical protein ZOSMA_338G00200 [Zostera marina]